MATSATFGLFCAPNVPPLTFGEYDNAIPLFASTAAEPFAAYPLFNEFATPEAAKELPVMLEMSRYETDELLPRFVALPTKVAMEVDMYGGIGVGGMPRLPAHRPAVCPPVKPSPVTEAYDGTSDMLDVVVQLFESAVPFDISFVEEEAAEVAAVEVDDDLV